MSSSRNYLFPGILLGTMLISMIGIRSLADRMGGPTGPATVATVNLNLLVSHLDEFSSYQAALQELGETLDREAEQKQTQIALQQQDHDLLEPGSPARDQAANELLYSSHRLAAYTEFAQRKINEVRAGNLRRIYASIKRAVASEARERGYTIVIVNDSVGEINASLNEDSTRLEIASRRLLYAEGMIDITSDLEERMNYEWEEHAPE